MACFLYRTLAYTRLNHGTRDTHRCLPNCMPDDVVCMSCHSTSSSCLLTYHDTLCYIPPYYHVISHIPSIRMRCQHNTTHVMTFLTEFGHSCTMCAYPTPISCYIFVYGNRLARADVNPVMHAECYVTTHVSSRHNMIHPIMSYHVVAHFIMSWYDAYHHVISYHISSCYDTSHHVISCHISSHHAMFSLCLYTTGKTHVIMFHGMKWL